jgi:hypothetical protein
MAGHHEIIEKCQILPVGDGKAAKISGGIHSLRWGSG